MNIDFENLHSVHRSLEIHNCALTSSPEHPPLLPKPSTPPPTTNKGGETAKQPGGGETPNRGGGERVAKNEEGTSPNQPGREATKKEGETATKKGWGERPKKKRRGEQKKGEGDRRKKKKFFLQCFRIQKTKGLVGWHKRFFWIQKAFWGHRQLVTDFFGGQRGPINCKIVLDILEGQKRQGVGVQRSAVQKQQRKAAAAKAARKAPTKVPKNRAKAATGAAQTAAKTVQTFWKVKGGKGGFFNGRAAQKQQKQQQRDNPKTVEVGRHDGWEGPEERVPEWWWGPGVSHDDPESPNVNFRGHRPSKTPPKLNERRPERAQTLKFWAGGGKIKRNFGRSSGEVRGKGPGQGIWRRGGSPRQGVRERGVLEGARK